MLRPTLIAGRLAWPTDWTAHFGRPGPLLIEIGFGAGDFLLDLARRRPEANVLGVEISLPSIRKVEGKLARGRQTNVQLIMGSAEALLWTACAERTVAELYVNFSDPWPKPAHHHRRLINPRFLHLAASRMPIGGLLDVATDHADYAAAIADAFEATPYFVSRIAATAVYADPERLVTKYEQKGIDEGRLIHYFKFRRSTISAAEAFPLPEELAMPHMILTLPLDSAAVEAAFRPYAFAAADTHMRYIAMYRAVHDGLLLVETHVGEAAVTQRVALTVRERAPHEFIIGLHDLGFPRPTRGIHAAILGLGQWLLQLHPDGRLLHSNLALDLPEEEGAA